MLLILFATLWWSCSNEHIEDISAKGDNAKGVVTFTINMPALSTPKTRALNKADENEVGEVAVILFDSDNNYAGVHYVGADEITTLSAGSGQKKAFFIEPVDGVYDIVLIANATDLVKSAIATMAATDQSRPALLGKLSIEHNGKWITDTGVEEYKQIPMWGEFPNAVTVSKDKPVRVEVNLIRMLVKIDVALTGAQAKYAFDLQEVHLFNSNNKGYVAPKVKNWNFVKEVANVPTVPSDAIMASAGILYDGNVVAKENNKGVSVTNEIYTFEALQGEIDELDNNVAVVIGGKYKDDANITYYRIDFANWKEEELHYLPLLRNHQYKVNVENVTSSGAATPEEAFEMGPVNTIARITEINLSEVTKVKFNDRYILGVSKENFIFSPLAHNSESKDNKLVVYTDFPDGFVVENKQGDWYTVEQTKDEATGLTTLQFIVEGLAESGVDIRKGGLTIRAGELTYAINLEQKSEPESNSYIVRPNTPGIFIPVSRANQSMLGEQLSTDDVFTAELVWTDKKGSNGKGIADDSSIKSIGVEGTGAAGYLVVEPGSAQGNAVVAIKKGGKILWSWHIWVTDFAPSSTVAAGSFMDRNLGAIGNTAGALGTKGLLYQWGRKDPFPGSTTITYDEDPEEPTLYNELGIVKIEKEAVTVNNNFANSVAKPATFYYGTAHPFDWYTKDGNATSRNNKLWDDGKKTFYDPCPEGWRVPKNGAWDGLDAHNFTWGNYGRTADSHGGFYPAAGYRSGQQGWVHSDYIYGGVFLGVGDYGYYWSATDSGEFQQGYSYSLFFYPGNNGDVLPSTPYPRASGFSVRCVKE